MSSKWGWRYRQFSDYDIERSLGNVGGHENIAVFGYNPSVNNSTKEHLWYNATTPYPYPTAAETIRVKAGGNANDDAAGTGAQTVKVWGLDENWDRITETLTTAGASASTASSQKFIRVFKAAVIDTGTYGGSNTGDLLIENTTSTDVLANLEALGSVTQICHYSVPRDHKLYITGIAVSVDAQRAGVYLISRAKANNTTSPQARHLDYTIPGGGLNSQVLFPSPLEYDEYTDVWCEALSQGASDAGVAASFTGILVRTSNS